jgi:hypothetical protein
MSAEQLEWRDQVLAYAAKINAFAARGLSSGWDKAGPQPPEPKLDHLMRTTVEAIRDANRRGTWMTATRTPSPLRLLLEGSRAGRDAQNKFASLAASVIARLQRTSLDPRKGAAQGKTEDRVSYTNPSTVPYRQTLDERVTLRPKRRRPLRPSSQT